MYPLNHLANRTTVNREWRLLFSFIFASLSGNIASGQEVKPTFFTPSDTFSQKRYNMALGFAVGTYATISTGLYFAWYDQYPKSRFHLFNDAGEWLDMDKAGHVYSSYFQAMLSYQGAKWTGMSEKKAITTGLVFGGLFQTTIEVMDGFSDQWGFSIPDMAANVGGVSAFALQQYLWEEQRITMKVGLYPSPYESFPITGSNGTIINSSTRRDQLYGATYLERYLKDYNSQSYWLSANVHSFLPEGNRWPKWLNLSLGYGGENMYGGFDNSWTTDGESFVVDRPRYRQFYLGFDLDLRHIETGSTFWNTVLDAFNIFKVPSPAIELNTRGELTFHLLR